MYVGNALKLAFVIVYIGKNLDWQIKLKIVTSIKIGLIFQKFK